jgi:hypothetical protein
MGQPSLADQRPHHRERIRNKKIVLSEQHSQNLAALYGMKTRDPLPVRVPGFLHNLISDGVPESFA